ncbi:unnamed protein product [Prorocentrum cordatum]|uniref:Uncharacterized protein n=1 Tax=Prorocentrum cordatum TaxID=2364126 RepID=A0ABN9RRI1_9DINO|nr:unnamed protein product [Polarella glacialis]
MIPKRQAASAQRVEDGESEGSRADEERRQITREKAKNAEAALPGGLRGGCGNGAAGVSPLVVATSAPARRVRTPLSQPPRISQTSGCSQDRKQAAGADQRRSASILCLGGNRWKPRWPLWPSARVGGDVAAQRGGREVQRVGDEIRGSSVEPSFLLYSSMKEKADDVSSKYSATPLELSGKYTPDTSTPAMRTQQHLDVDMYLD